MFCIEAMPVKAARQYLPPLPGYIPVYIQDGESPPDVESIYEVLDQSPTDDKMDTDVQVPNFRPITLLYLNTRSIIIRSLYTHSRWF